MKGNLYDHLFTGSIQDPYNGRSIAIQHFGDIVLPPIGTDMLVEVSFGVHESHGDKRNTQIAAFL